MRIFDLWKATWPTECDQAQWLAWWCWNLANPAGGEAYVAEADGSVVGLTRVMYLNVKIRDRTVKAYQGCDFMTHPNYRGLGIGVELMRQGMLRGAEKAEAVFGYVFPTDASYGLWTRHLSGWYDLGKVPQFLRPIHWKAVIKWAIGNSEHKWSIPITIAAMGAKLAFTRISRRIMRKSPRTGLVVNQIDRFDSRVDSLCREASSLHEIMVVRNEQYLNWRYHPPGNVYRLFVAQESSEIRGYAVVQDLTQGGIATTYIVDIVTGSAEVAGCLLSRLVEECKLRNADLLLYPVISRTYESILTHNGFISLHSVKGPRLCVYPHSSAPRELLAKRENWLVQIGDSDFCTFSESDDRKTVELGGARRTD